MEMSSVEFLLLCLTPGATLVKEEKVWAYGSQFIIYEILDRTEERNLDARAGEEAIE